MISKSCTCKCRDLVHDFEIVHVQAKAVAPTWRKKLLRCKSFSGLKKPLHVLTPGYSSIDNTSHKARERLEREEAEFADTQAVLRVGTTATPSASLCVLVLVSPSTVFVFGCV